LIARAMATRLRMVERARFAAMQAARSSAEQREQL